MADTINTTSTNPAVTPATPVGTATTTPETSPYRQEAKSRFNAALDEAKAGASALKDEALSRANSYRDQAKGKGDELSVDAKVKSRDLASEGKAKASGALAGLSRVVEEKATTIDENFGPKYGDYARSASRSMQESAESLERKSIEELGEDLRAFVRTKPGTAVGIAAATGFVFARLFRS